LKALNNFYLHKAQIEILISLSKFQIISYIFETGEWASDFTEVTTITSNNKPKATKCSDHPTISLIAYTPKIVAKILRRRIERNIEDVSGKDQFGFTRGDGSRDATGMRRNLDIDGDCNLAS
jgi:hypothetical protein